MVAERKRSGVRKRDDEGGAPVIPRRTFSKEGRRGEGLC